MTKPRRELTPGRKATYYAGMAVAAAGALSFGSGFCTVALNSGREFDPGTMPLRAVLGMGLIVVGFILMAVGRAGLAGAGFVLDPQKQREDLEPWTRAAGGMISDAASEVGAVSRVTDALQEKQRPVVKVRCPKCRSLNDETAKFCNNCGAALNG
jgi:hypothetical protein